MAKESVAGNKTGANRALLGYAFLIFTGITFGTFEVVSRLMPNIVPMQLNFLRFLIGGSVILPFGIAEVRKKGTSVKPVDMLYIAIIGSLLVAASMTLLQISVTKVPASLVAFIFSANPMIIAVLAALILRERPNSLTYIFIALGMAGILLIIRPFGGGFDADILYPLSSVVLFGLYIVLARKLSRRLGSLFVTATAILSGVAVLGLYATASGVRLFAGIKTSDLPYLIYLGSLVSGLAYVTYFKGMDMTSTNTGSSIFFMKALTAAVLSSIVLEEVLSPSVYLGAAFIAAGIFVMIYGSIRKNRAK